MPYNIPAVYTCVSGTQVNNYIIAPKIKSYNL